MSKYNTEEITCPSCHHKGSFEIWSSINTVLNPKLKEKVLSQELFKYTCPNCRERWLLIAMTSQISVMMTLLSIEIGSSINSTRKMIILLLNLKKNKKNLVATPPSPCRIQNTDAAKNATSVFWI